MTHVIRIHVTMDSVLRVANLTNVIVMLATLVQRVTTVSNVQLCVVNRKREGDYADESSNIFDYIPFTFILSKRSNKNPTKTKTEMHAYHTEG